MLSRCEIIKKSVFEFILHQKSITKRIEHKIDNWREQFRKNFDLSYDLFDKNDHVLSDPGFDGFPALDFRTVQHDHYLQGKMAVTPIGQRFEDDCKYYKMTFVEALLCKFNIFPLDRSEEENIPFDKRVMAYPESLAIVCLYSS